MIESNFWGAGMFGRSWYQYDRVGREVATWRDEQGGKGERFWYDVTNQLTNVRYNAEQVWTGNPLNANHSMDYTYSSDKLNRTGVIVDGVMNSYTPNVLNQYVNVAGQPIGYNENFSMFRYNGWQYNYAQNQLVSMWGNGHSAEFVYDGLGRCLKRTIDGVTKLHLYDNWQPVVDYDGANNFLCWNLYGPSGPDDIIMRASPSRVEFYQKDREGNVKFITDGGVTILESYTYDAFGQATIRDLWGNLRSDSWLDNRFMFTGREYFPQLGIYDYRHRMYHPSLGRFLQTDPTGFDAGDMNLFRYCADDPVDGSDPTGLVDRTWDRQLYMQGGSQRSFEVDEQIKDLHSNGYVTVGHILFEERNKADSTPGQPSRNLGGSSLDKLGGEMARLAFNTGPPGQEQISWLFEKNGTPGAYAASVPIPGGAEPKQVKEEGNQPKLGAVATPTFIPKGYHYVGFAYSHLQPDKVIPLADRERAWRNRLDAYLAVPQPGNGFSRMPRGLEPCHYDPNVFPTN
jgi:RHS repeat-associated protein